MWNQPIPSASHVYRNTRNNAIFDPGRGRTFLCVSFVSINIPTLSVGEMIAISRRLTILHARIGKFWFPDWILPRPDRVFTLPDSCFFWKRIGVLVNRIGFCASRIHFPGSRITIWPIRIGFYPSRIGFLLVRIQFYLYRPGCWPFLKDENKKRIPPYRRILHEFNC